MLWQMELAAERGVTDLTTEVLRELWFEVWPGIPTWVSNMERRLLAGGYYGFGFFRTKELEMVHSDNFARAWKA